MAHSDQRHTKEKIITLDSMSFFKLNRERNVLRRL